MSLYGDYQVIKEIGWSNGATLFSARKGNSEEFAIKVFSLAFFGFAGDNDRKAQEFSDLFNSRLEQQKKASLHSPRFAPIFAEGFDTDSAWYVTRLYRNSVQKLIESKAVLRGDEFFTLVNAIVQATVSFKTLCGRSHGNIKATNVLLAKPGTSGLNEIVLADAAPGDASKATECELADLRGIGEIIHRLVINEDREEEYWTVPPPPTLQEWVTIFGKDGEAWHNLCARLLEPDLNLRHYNLEELVFDLKQLQAKPKVSPKLVMACAAVVVVLGVVGVFAMKRSSAPGDSVANAEMRQKQAIDQAARLAKEKRLAEERAQGESAARLEAQRKMELSAKDLAEEKRLIQERATREARQAEENRRQSLTTSQQKLEEQQRLLKAAEERRAVEEARSQQLVASQQKPVETASAAKSVPATTMTKPSLGREWSNTLGMRFLPVTNAKLLICSWETRRKDYEQFVKQSHYTGDLSWRSTTFKQGDSEPVVNVAPTDAVAFCKWLTENERKQGLISSAQAYRLPTDAEWNQVSEAEEGSALIRPFPWGRALTPPIGAGNFAQWCSYDRFAFTAPVGAFQPNSSGVHDLAGNVWEMCRNGSAYVGRGGSWQTEVSEQLQVLFRLPVMAGDRKQDVGFRCVLDFAAVD